MKFIEKLYRPRFELELVKNFSNFFDTQLFSFFIVYEFLLMNK